MGGNQSIIDQESVTNICVSSIIQVTQQQASDIKQSNIIKIDMNKSNQITMNARLDCQKLFASYSKDISKDIDKITKNCKESYPLPTVEGVNIEGVLNVNLINSQTSDITAEQKMDIVDKIKSSVSQKSGILSGNDSKVKIRDFINVNVSTIIETMQKSVNNLNVDNQIVINGGGVKGILLNSIVNDVVKNLQYNKVFQSNVTKLTKDLEADVSQTGGLSNIILIIIISIVAFFIVLFLIITLIKISKSKSKDSSSNPIESQSKFNYESPIRYRTHILKKKY